MFNTIKARDEAISILEKYDGKNPFILKAKMDVFVNNKDLLSNESVVEYILKNNTNTPRVINKVIPIADWYGVKMQEKYEIEFTPAKIFVLFYFGETERSIHCLIKYRQNMEPLEVFLPRKAIGKDFMLDDYHNINVDFDRYDKLSTSKDPNRILFPHQKEAVQFLLSRKKSILADGMGLGKTTSLSVSAIEGNFDSILIICPASIKTNWKEELLWYVDERDITIIESINDKTKTELEEFLGYAKGKSNMTVAELKKEAEESGKWKNNRFVIINYDILDRFYQIPKTRSKANIEEAFKNSPLLQYIADRKSLIIIDEAHLLSNNTSIRYKVINDLIKRGKPHSIYLSTGTPITNNPLNLYYLLKLLDDPIIHDWQFYVNRYCDAMKIPAKGEKEKWTNFFLRSVHKSSWYDLTGDEKDSLKVYIREHARMINLTNGASNLDELRDKISHLYLRRTKEDLERSLPEKRIHELYYDFTSQQKAEYDKLWEEYEEAQLEADPTKELNKDLLEGAIYRRYCSNQMVPNTIKLADEFISKGEKVVIFCCYDEELYTLKDYYGEKCVIYNGKMSPKEKDNSKNQFVNNQDKLVFIGNIQAASVGITLICSHILIFNNITYVPSDQRQCEDRIHRIGQTKKCDIYYQFFKGTQYEKIWNTIMKKELSINLVIKKESEK